MGSGIRFSDNNGNQGNRCIGPREKQFCTMPQDTVPLWLRTNHISGTIHKGNQRDIEQIAKPDKPCRLISRIYINSSGHTTWLICHDPDGSAIKTGKPGNHIRCIATKSLEKVAIINHLIEYFIHIKYPIRLIRDNFKYIIQFPFRIILGLNYRRCFAIIGREKREKFFTLIQTIFIILSDDMRLSRLFRLRFNPAKILQTDFLSGLSFNKCGSGNP